MEDIRIGIIGAGQIGKGHVGGYAKVKGAKMVALCDIDEAEAQKVAKENNIPEVYTDFRKMLVRKDIDAVDVCLHNNFHSPVTLECLRAGKHVYCEKPMAGAYVDAKTMYDEARKAGKKLHIQLGTLYGGETKMAKRLIDGGHLGKVYHARSTGYRRRGRPFVDGYGTSSFVQKKVAAGGALYDMGVYHIAQILFLLNRPKVERISGKVYQETDLDAQRGKVYDVEELGLGFVKFAGGLTLDIIESWAIHMGPFENSYIVGSKGGVRLSPFSFHTNLDDVPMDATFNVSGANWRWHQLNENEDVHDGSQMHWISALQGRCELWPTAEVALQTMLISEGIYLSDKLGREVTAEEVLANSKSTAVKV